MKQDEYVAQSLDDLVTPLQVKIQPKEANSQLAKKTR